MAVKKMKDVPTNEEVRTSGHCLFGRNRRRADGGAALDTCQGTHLPVSSVCTCRLRRDLAPWPTELACGNHGRCTALQESEIAMREVRVLQLAKHVNIVNLLEAYRSQSGRLYLVFGG